MNISATNGNNSPYPSYLPEQNFSNPSGSNYWKSLTDKLFPMVKWPNGWACRKRYGLWPMPTEPMPSPSLPLATGSSGATAPSPDLAEALTQNVFCWNWKAVNKKVNLVKLIKHHLSYFFTPIQVHLCQIDSNGPCLCPDSHHLQNAICNRNVKNPISRLTVYPQ